MPASSTIKGLGGPRETLSRGNDVGSAAADRRKHRRTRQRGGLLRPSTRRTGGRTKRLPRLRGRADTVGGSEEAVTRTPNLRRQEVASAPSSPSATWRGARTRAARDRTTAPGARVPCSRSLRQWTLQRRSCGPRHPPRSGRKASDRLFREERLPRGIQPPAPRSPLLDQAPHTVATSTCQVVLGGRERTRGSGDDPRPGGRGRRSQATPRGSQALVWGMPRQSPCPGERERERTGVTDRKEREVTIAADISHLGAWPIPPHRSANPFRRPEGGERESGGSWKKRDDTTVLFLGIESSHCLLASLEYLFFTHGWKEMASFGNIVRFYSSLLLVECIYR
ncbi:uncharacterized protein [Hetaerina americana]|uniref:uncharacterized protein n=1 Tax=Hetaerina americana TaxID=62018 RepID=UPI003A7F0F88